MNHHSLLASAAINIGLAFIILSLFSILKKQPSLASIYYAHRLSHHHYIPFDSSFHRFLPSISWISKAYHVTEDDILQSHGLDALKYTCWVARWGKAIVKRTGLDPSVLDYDYDPQSTLQHQVFMSQGPTFCHDAIANNQTKSLARKIEDLRETSMTKKHKNKLPLLNFSQQTSSSKVDLLEEKLLALCHKIHQLQCKDMLKKKELPVAFVTFKSRSAAAVVAQLQQHTHPLLWVTELAPEPRDVSWRNLRVSYRVIPLYRLGVVIAASLLTIFFAIPVTAVQGIAKYEKLKKWFPPAMVVQLISSKLLRKRLSSIVTGYLPSVVLKGFIYIVPFAMFAMAKVSGYVSRSKEEIKACSMPS
ncbi:hypothetical protein TSUD_120990 [Trifolium subterraneum]|uniref:CSC1/OSCA1-like 7TM region domain-containing protein n=1 Tax=Trifolium subterraneum TaxID=3900 RepID=A0A2Z6LQ64_TRISU|nr:hypothetical protein TSUD_120990 [Trifolium subterraneum]